VVGLLLYYRWCLAQICQSRSTFSYLCSPQFVQIEFHSHKSCTEIKYKSLKIVWTNNLCLSGNILDCSFCTVWATITVLSKNGSQIIVSIVQTFFLFQRLSSPKKNGLFFPSNKLDLFWDLFWGSWDYPQWIFQKHWKCSYYVAPTRDNNVFLANQALRGLFEFF
jgi:hypothetical protein